MAASSFEHTQEAATALRDAVTGSGPEILCDPMMLSSVLADLMPGATGAARMLVAAAEDRVIELIRDHLAQGISIETAVQMVAASFARTSLYSLGACTWVVEAFAEAGGLDSEPGPADVGPAEERLTGAEPPTKKVPVSDQETTWATESAQATIADDGADTVMTSDPVAGQTDTIIRPPIAGDGQQDGPDKTSAGRRIRRPLLIAVGTALVLAAGGITAAAFLLHSGPPKPVNPARPAELNVVNLTFSSVVIGWSEPRGPRPTRYLIFEDDQPVGSVPAGTDSYTATGLSAATTYNFKVVAVRGHHRSRESGGLAADTTSPPPVSQANLAGYWTVNYSHFTSTNLTRNVTSLGSDTWTITSECQSGSCTAHVSGSFQNKTLTMTLRPSHGTYSAKATVNGYIQCSETTIKQPNYLTFKLKPTGGSVVSDQWMASSFTGTFTDNVDEFGGCEAGGFTGRMHASS